MIVILAASFTIADGYDRTAQVVDEAGFTLNQVTQVSQPLRAAWVRGFHLRAVRSLQRSYKVTYPACASLEAAQEQAITIPVQCPNGGVLTEQTGSSLITFEDAWIDGGIQVERLGVRNIFTFNFTAINPDTAALSTLAAMDSRYPNILTLVGLTGGGATKLDGATTTDVAVGRIVEFVITESSVIIPHKWLLRTWTDEVEDAAAGIVIPDDFHATTNPKFWHRLS